MISSCNVFNRIYTCESKNVRAFCFVDAELQLGCYRLRSALYRALSKSVLLFASSAFPIKQGLNHEPLIQEGAKIPAKIPQTCKEL